jgi:hypothetical protein
MQGQSSDWKRVYDRFGVTAPLGLGSLLQSLTRAGGDLVVSPAPQYLFMKVVGSIPHHSYFLPTSGNVQLVGFER